MGEVRRCEVDDDRKALFLSQPVPLIIDGRQCSQGIGRYLDPKSGLPDRSLENFAGPHVERELDPVAFLYVTEVVFRQVSLYPAVMDGDEGHERCSGRRVIALVNAQVCNQAVAGRIDHRAFQVNAGVVQCRLRLPQLRVVFIG